MATTEKKKIKGRRKGLATIKTIMHPEGASAQAGHEERLASFIKRTLQLKKEGKPYHQIAEIIAEEYQLEKVPHIATVANWRNQGMEAIGEDIEKLRIQLRIDQFNDLEDMKAKWLPLANAKSLEVMRWVMEEGSLQPKLDENAIKEQIEATKQVINIMTRQARLLGLDMERVVTTTGEGPQSLADLQLWMIGQVNIHGGKTSQEINITGKTLELKSGIPELDSDSV